MTWLQKLYTLAQYKPMAVPIIKDIDYNKGDGYNQINHTMTEETAQKETEKYPEMSYLGQGIVGLATQLPNGHVIKYTTDEEEALSAEYVMNRHPNCCAIVYKVENIQQGLWSIELEKVKVLSIMEKIAGKIIADFLYHSTGDLAEINSSRKNPDPKFLKEIEKNKNELHKDYLSLISKIPNRLNYIVKDYIEMWNCLAENGLSGGDAHASNVGYNSNNKLVLFDFGYSYVQETDRIYTQLNRFDVPENIETLYVA